MDFWQSMGGMTELELTSSDIQGALGEISGKNIPVYHVVYLSDLTVRFQICRRDGSTVRALCEKRGEALKLCGKSGLFWMLRGLVARPVLVFGFLFYLGMTVFLPTRVFFVRVEGNQTIPTNAILEAADQAGVCFGASRRDVRSEKIKNALLDAIPQLQWAGVNTVGCVAVISVRERTLQQTQTQEGEVSSIVSAADGRIYACTATRGTLLCQEGDLVRRGQVLISGYTDCGLSIRATRAEGEIYAETARFLTAITPADGQQIRKITGVKKKYRILFGKTRINFWENSGNWEDSCGRIYKEYYITLPGGFSLPFGIAVETIQFYETEAADSSEEEARQLLSDFARRAVTEQMVAGGIEAEYVTVTREDAGFRLEGTYACREMIGRVQQEQIGEMYVKND